MDPLYHSEHARKLLATYPFDGKILDTFEDESWDGCDQYGPKAIIYTLYVTTESSEGYTYYLFGEEQRYDGSELVYELTFRETYPFLVKVNQFRAHWLDLRHDYQDLHSVLLRIFKNNLKDLKELKEHLPHGGNSTDTTRMTLY